jgi:hypothetical protein
LDSDFQNFCVIEFVSLASLIMEERIRCLERTVKLQACEMKRLQATMLENHSPSPKGNPSLNQKRKKSSGIAIFSSQVTTPTYRNPTQQSTAVNQISSDNETIRERVVSLNKAQPKNVANNVSGTSNGLPISSSSSISSSSQYPSSTSSFATTSAAIHMILKSPVIKKPPATIKSHRNRNILVEKTPRTMTIREKKKKAQKSISNYLKTMGPLEITEVIKMEGLIYRKISKSTINRNIAINKSNNITISNDNANKKENGNKTNGISNSNDLLNHNNTSSSSIIPSSFNLKRKNISSDLNGSLKQKKSKKMPISRAASVSAVNMLDTSQSKRIMGNAGTLNQKNQIDDDVVILNGRSAPLAPSLSSYIPTFASHRPNPGTTAALAAAASKAGIIRRPTSTTSLQNSPSSSSIPRPAFIAALDTAKAARTVQVTQETNTRQNVLDITGDPVVTETGRVEGDQEMEKMNKVITLIKSLDTLVDRIQMVEQLLDTFQTKPVKLKKLIDAGKEVFQEWLSDEISKFPEKVDILLIESILSILDKATWTVDDVCRLRIDKTLRVLYKACCSTDKSTLTSINEYTNIISQTKKMWPRYRNMFKNVAKI